MAHRTSEERQDLAEYVRRHREAGYRNGEIAARLGISESYVSQLFTDPDGAKARARKDGYRGTCEKCGAKTDGSGGPAAAPKRCASCTAVKQHEERHWTQEAVVDAIQRYAAVHGRPPRATDWLLADPVNDYPASSTVYSHAHAPFRYWADAVEAAGFDRPRVGKREGDRHWDNAEDVLAAILARTVDGVPPSSSADAGLVNAAMRFFGSWRAALAEIGLEPRVHYRRWTEETVVAEIRRAAVGGYPPLTTENKPLYQGARWVFGTWERAVRAAGFEPYPKGHTARSRERRRRVTGEARPTARRPRAASRSSAPA